MTTRILTGITTTGTPHLGNYAGAIRPAILASRDAAADSFYFLADYHALIKCQDPERVERSRLAIAATFLAAGLDPERLHDQSYYFRPFMIGLGDFLGVKAAEEYLFLLIGGPAGSYFQGGIKPVTIWVEEEYVRASPGGTGRAKCAGNYAASLLPAKTAKQRGCDQVLYLDAVHRKYLEELGGMNVFLVLQENGRTVIATPEKSGTILEGVTRDSLITVAKDLGYEVVERRISIDDVEQAHRDGILKEAFACGTAAVISPIGTFMSKRGSWTLNNNQVGEVAMGLRAALLDIQYGMAPDTRQWMHNLL